MLWVKQKGDKMYYHYISRVHLLGCTSGIIVFLKKIAVDCNVLVNRVTSKSKHKGLFSC